MAKEIVQIYHVIDNQKCALLVFEVEIENVIRYDKFGENHTLEMIVELVDVNGGNYSYSVKQRLIDLGISQEQFQLFKEKAKEVALSRVVMM